MTSPGAPGRFPPAALLAFAVAGYVALVVFASGLLSLATDRDVIATPGLSPVPGPLAAGVAALAFAASLWPALRQEHPKYTAVIGVALFTALAHLAALWILALVFGADVATATGAVGGAATSWTSAVFAGAAVVAGWAALAVRRTHAHRPQWPWEQDEDGE
ncbi:hypothetical protein B5M43_012150 [Microbacterium sp. MEC084]|uniref:hypothetical protein n=1 Tax=Microbacterium sp. MEC084 TaxID=1963027 RepID=UPI00106F0D97|nr:hypothetical protein [Microbacterium sp. MEC084]MCD1269576.1 hypothetical protein [Microbacterium sp. MEC084]